MVCAPSGQVSRTVTDPSDMDRRAWSGCDPVGNPSGIPCDHGSASLGVGIDANAKGTFLWGRQEPAYSNAGRSVAPYQAGDVVRAYLQVRPEEV